LKGWHLQGTHRPADLDRAMQYYELAIAKDPSYAPAHAGVAWVWLARAQAGSLSRAEALPRMKAAALKSMELDENLADSHRVAASIKTWHEWDWAGGEQEFRRTIELNPGTDARAGYSHLLMYLQRPKEAEEQSVRSLELDRFNVHAQSFRAQLLVALGRYDEAIAQAREVLRSVPDQGLASGALEAALRMEGRHDEVVAEWKRQATLSGRRGEIEAFERGFREGGYRTGWKRLAEYEGARFSLNAPHSYATAVHFCRAGEDDRALDWLERTFEGHDPNMPYAFAWPHFENLRSHPRFQALRRKMNLPG
jgi:serine/threonine-protein kinase